MDTQRYFVAFGKIVNVRFPMEGHIYIRETAYFLCFLCFQRQNPQIGPEMSFFFHQNKYTQAPAILSFFLKSSACIKSNLPHVENRM